MLFLTEPSDFKKKYDVVCCICIRDDKVLLLQRQDHKPQGSQWGFPAGKVDPAEPLLKAIQRELAEETGLTLAEAEFTYLGKAYTRYPDYDFLFHMYKAQIPPKLVVTINPNEHKKYTWIELNQLKTLDLMEDLEGCIDTFLK